MTAAAVSTTPPVIVVQAAGDKSPLIFMGFIATADGTTLTSLKREADRRGIVAKITKGPNSDELMVAFPPQGHRANELAFYHAAIAGQFGHLKLEVMVNPLAAVQAGKGLDQATAEDPSFIVDPKN